MSRGVTLLPYVLAAFVPALCAWWIWRKRYDAPGASAYVVAMIAECWWSVGYVFELQGTTLPQKLFWDDFQLPPVFVLAFAYLIFAMRYTRRRSPFGVIAALSVVPIVTCAFVLTDPIHHMARAGAHIVRDEPFGALVYDFTAIEYVAWIQIYAMALPAVWMLASYAVANRRTYRVQLVAVVLGLALPMITGLLAVSGARVTGQRDIAPLAFALQGALTTWGLWRSRFLDLVPIARAVVIENLPDGVVVLDAKERVVDLNAAAMRLLDCGADVVGRDVASLVPAWVALRETLRSQRSADVEMATAGEVHRLEAQCSRIPGDGHELTGSILLLRDVTEQRRIEAALAEAREHLEDAVKARTRELSDANRSLREQITERETAQEAAVASERKFRAIFDQTFQFIGLLDLDGTLLEANRSALEFAGYDERDVVGKPFWNTPWWRHSEELQSRVRDAIREAVGGTFVRFEATHIARDGSTRFVDFSIKPVRDALGAVVMLIPEGRDISEQKIAEKQREQLANELAHTQRLDSLGRLAGGIAHDFNNLLTAILASAEWAQDELPESHPAREGMTVVRDAATSAAALTRQLLAFGRKQRIEPVLVDPNDVIERVTRLIARVIGENIEVRTSVPSDRWSTAVDPTLVEQVLVNLAVNARDAMPRGGTLTLEAANVAVDDAHAQRAGARADDYVRFTVRDTGIGMSDEVKTRVFDPFFTTKGAGKGTGLGLATVWGTISQHQGFVEVDSVVGRGSTFHVYLPRAGAVTPARRASVAREGSAKGGRHRIVLVEDQPQVRELSARLLRNLGYDVQVFENAEAAIDLIEAPERGIDLLVTDVVLPGMSGRELADRLISRRPGTKVLFMSGYADDVMSQHGVSKAAIPIVQKPFTATDLASAVRVALHD